MPKRACPKPTQSHQWLGIIAFLLLASPSRGQVGTNICACTPPTYEFTLNFDLTCDNTFVPSSGVAEFECVVQPFQTGATIDLRPARVETIDFVEYDQSNRRLAEASIFDPIGNGETITYTSYSANPGDVTTPTVPKALQITMLAQNSVGQPLLMTWLIAFTNSCATYPVITVGNQIGWTEIVSMTGRCLFVVAFFASYTCSLTKHSRRLLTVHDIRARRQSLPSGQPSTNSPTRPHPNSSDPSNSSGPGTFSAMSTTR